jgi:excisionase family DNA binding protein
VFFSIIFVGGKVALKIAIFQKLFFRKSIFPRKRTNAHQPPLFLLKVFFLEKELTEDKMQAQTEPTLQSFVSTSEGAELTGYSRQMVRVLAQSGRVNAHKVGRDWLIERASLIKYRTEMDRLGPQKHDPTRG